MTPRKRAQEYTLRRRRLATKSAKTTRNLTEDKEDKFVYIRAPKFFIMREKEEDFNVDFLDPERVKATEEKVKSGKIVCDIHAPEGCENCSG